MDRSLKKAAVREPPARGGVNKTLFPALKLPREPVSGLLGINLQHE
jgi:hypothetical protein